MFDLRLGDCLEVMADIPDGSVDLVLCDPPYGINFQSQWKKDKADWLPKIANDKTPFVAWLQLAYDALRDGGCALVFTRWDVWQHFHVEAERCGFRVKDQIVWDKMQHGTGDLKGSPGPRHELAIMLTKGRFTFAGRRPQSVIQIKKVPPAKLAHPNEKPVALMEALVNSYCPEGGVVLDPCMGVSPVGVACVITGRKFIGIELSPDYFEIARSRIEQAHKAKTA